jgi:hypothetical protein
MIFLGFPESQLQGFELFESFFAVIAIMNRPAEGWPERVFEFGVGAVATWARNMFQHIDVNNYFSRGWRGKAKFFQG